jgi:amino acid transporter
VEPIIICTVLYVIIALVLTGMVSYSLLDVGDPLAFVFGIRLEVDVRCHHIGAVSL